MGDPFEACICRSCKCTISGDTADEFNGRCPECDEIIRQIEEEEAADYERS